MKKNIYSLVVLAFLAAGCSENTPDFPTNSSVEENEDSRISSFDIDPAMLDGEMISRIGYANLKKGFFSLETYNAELRHQGSSVRCGLHLDASSSLENGEYLLTFSDIDGQPLKGMFRIEVNDDRIIKVSEAKGSFSLRSGSGTPEDPYIIGSARDFLMFLDDLRENELTNGRDVWFQQTADITLMDQSSTKPGRGYYGYSFAGHYDGGGHALKEMYYRGAENPEADSRIGIFPSLLDGATVSNLTISGVNISSTYADTGTLAGTVAGTVSISGIRMTGSVISDKATNIGAFIGRMEKGYLTASDVKICGPVKGNKNVGGVIGYIENGNAEFSGVSTPESHFSVEGYECVGGIIGSSNECSLKVKDSRLQHVVSKEDSDIRSIQTTGGEATGGIIGQLTGSKTAELTNVEIGCPVGGLKQSGNKIGGLIGRASTSGDVILDGCRVTSVVSGGWEIGGYFGHCEITGNGKLKIKGNSKANHIIPDDSAAGIEGISQVGGAIGLLSKTSILLDSDAKIRIGLNVEATDADCGGAVGKITDSTIDLSFFDMTSPTMQVSGVKNTGGMIGYAYKSTIIGNTPFNFEVIKNFWARVPEPSEFTPVFSGIVKGRDNLGGLIGCGQNVTIKALASSCTVTAAGGDNIGGIAGHIITSGYDNVFEDLVSMSMITASNSKCVGGIFGYVECDESSFTTDCINYGNITGGTDTGGIIGLYSRIWHNNFSENKYKGAEVRWCVNQGTIRGANRVGGVAGHVHSSVYHDKSHETSVWLHNCGNNGEVSSDIKTEDDSGVGGIVGYANEQLKLEHNANNGTISSSAPHKGVGGIAGSLGMDAFKDYRTTVLNVQMYTSVNMGLINSTNESSRVGGILGFMEEGPDSFLRNCANYGEVRNKHKSDNGGILGYVDHLGKIYDCVNAGKVEHGNGTIGTHKQGSIFDHDGLYMLDGTGKTWPSATVIKEQDFIKRSSYPRLDFEETWNFPVTGPIPAYCYFIPPQD